MRVRATLGYDGSGFKGWQRQRSARTVQAELERVLARITGTTVSVQGSGRTDAGVHATGQVAHFDTLWDRPLAILRRAMNAELPREIVVHDLQQAEEGFHARHSARWRAYRYTILARPMREPLLRRTSFHVRRPLDVAAMRRSVGELIGRHDFAAFGRPMTPGGPTERHMMDGRLREVGEQLHVELRANAFLRHQVRRIVGHLVDVGLGRAGSQDTAALVQRGSVGIARLPWRTPAQGLVLVAVGYDEEAIDSASRVRHQPAGE